MIQNVINFAGKKERWKTMHSLREAIRVAGWELAELKKAEKEE